MVLFANQMMSIDQCDKGSCFPVSPEISLISAFRMKHVLNGAYELITFK